MKCLGFGEYEKKCTSEAGTNRTPYWCQRCDDLRCAHITKQFEKIEERMAKQK